MLTIRREQWDALGRCSSESFEERCVDWLMRNRPRDCEKFGENALRELVHTGALRCERYRITSEPDVRQFIEMMLDWGPDFDRSPDLPWAAEVLAWDVPGETKMRSLAMHASAEQEARLARGRRP